MKGILSCLLIIGVVEWGVITQSAKSFSDCGGKTFQQRARVILKGKGNHDTLRSDSVAPEEKPRTVSREGAEYLKKRMKSAPFGATYFDLQALRAGMGSRNEPRLEGVRLIRFKIGDIPCEWVLAPGADPDLRLLYLHGGGWVSGSGGNYLPLAADISLAASCAVLLPDYRLAPEHPFPAPVEDAETAYRWLLEKGADPTRLCIAGDSAGGGLTVAALTLIRDAGLPLPAAGICLSPWTDMEATGGSMDKNSGVDPMIVRAGILDFATTYLKGADPKSPLATQLHAALNGLPPLLIQVGSIETLLDDSTRLEVAAKKAGVEVTLEIWDDMPHVWHMFAPKLPEAVKALESVGTFFKARISALD